MTDKELKLILDDMVILCDNREKKNEHILSYFDAIGVKYRVEKLETADYTFILPNYPEINIDKQVLVEKKNSLDEIAGNFTKDRDRFTREFNRVTTEKIHLVIEGATWKKVLKGSYRSKFPPKSFMASLLTFNVRYDCPVWFTGIEESPILIYNIMYYGLLEHLKGLRGNV